MSTSSISLESLQHLLQHMDANRRIEIYNRCPSLRKFEESVPLKIDSLVFEKDCVIVNETTYKLGIIRKYNVGETPNYVTESNENGGLPFEVDKYGIKDELDKYKVTAGDVEIDLPRDPYILSEYARMRRLENRIQDYEEQIARERERGPNRYQDDLGEIIYEVSRAKFFDYQCRRDLIPPNFEHFFQLTTTRIVDGQQQKTIQRYAHNKKYSEALKHLTTVLLGGRSSPISVRKFKLVCSVGVIRLPIDVRFHVEQLLFNGRVRTTLEALAPILHESSYPLKKLAPSLLTVNEVNNPIVRAAESLTIRVRRSTEISRALASFTNPMLHITMPKFRRTSLKKIMAKCVQSRRPFGTEFIVHFHREPHFENEMEDILRRLNGVPIDDENVIIPRTGTTNLKVSYGPFPEFAPHSKWAVRFSTEMIERR
ncbi:unnamed protein product [Caenorhabditis brenneri]